MLLGIVSDTHGDIPRTRAAVQMLDSLGVAAVIHCGDIGTPEVIALFAPWPTHFVFGNCDCDRKTLARVIERAGQTCHGTFGELEFEATRIAFTHGDNADLLHATRSTTAPGISSATAILTLCGQERIGNTLVLNPGAVHRANPHTIATVELPGQIVRIFVQI